MNWDWNSKFNQYSNSKFSRDTYNEVLNNMFREREKTKVILRDKFRNYIKSLEYTPYEEITIKENTND